MHRRSAECLLAREILASFSKFADVGQPTARCYTLRRFVISFTCRLRVCCIVARLTANFPSHFPSIIPIETAIKINRSLAGLPLGSSRFSLLAYLFFLLIRKEREKETKREREKDIGKNMMDNPCSLLFRL